MRRNKLVLLIIYLLPFSLFAQKDAVSELVFNKKAYDCENHWVAFPKKPTDSIYSYGFIYMDNIAGLTFNFDGVFSIDRNGRFLAKPNEKTKIIKYRLGANTNMVSTFSEKRLTELNLPKEPDFLKHYRTNNESLQDLINLGSHYNQAGAFHKAIVYLNKAYHIDPHARKLEFELAYNYNATGKYQSAIDILLPAIKADQSVFLYYRELTYSYIHLRKLEDAEKTTLLGIEISNNRLQKGEVAYNMAYGYFSARNKEKFIEWKEKTESFVSPDSPLLRSLQELFKRINANIKQ